MLSTRLAPILQEKLEEHNVTQEIGTADAGIIKIKNELAEVNDIMRSNIHKVLDRGDRLDDLQENTNELVSSSVMFQRQARKLKRKMWRERWMWYVAIFCAWRHSRSSSGSWCGFEGPDISGDLVLVFEHQA